MLSVTTEQLEAAVRTIMSAALQAGLIDMPAYDSIKEAYQYTSHASLIEAIASSVVDMNNPDDCPHARWKPELLRNALAGVDTVLCAALLYGHMSRSNYVTAHATLGNMPTQSLGRVVNGLRRILMDSDADFGL